MWATSSVLLAKGALQVGQGKWTPLLLEHLALWLLSLLSSPHMLHFSGCLAFDSEAAAAAAARRPSCARLILLRSSTVGSQPSGSGEVTTMVGGGLSSSLRRLRSGSWS